MEKVIKHCGNCHKTDVFDNVKFTVKGKLHRFYGKDICVNCFNIVKSTIEQDPYYNQKATYKDGIPRHNPSYTVPLSLARKRS